LDLSPLLHVMSPMPIDQALPLVQVWMQRWLRRTGGRRVLGIWAFVSPPCLHLPS
jgi:hypothetical protein